MLASKILLVLLLLLILYSAWESSTLEVTDITVANNKIPNSFCGFKIVQISDLHNKEFGKDSETLLQKVEVQTPDIIVITGDLVDSRRTNFEKAVTFVERAVKIAPVYYVNGNHESRLDNYWYLKQQLQKAGATVLENEIITLKKEGSEVVLLGLTDPDFYNLENSEAQFEQNLRRLKEESGGKFTILLSHRPEKMDSYKNTDIDLVFSGHAHGGQVRLPFIGAVAAPEQGFFPKYAAGSYKEENTTLVVSRGLANSVLFPIRTLNKPEVVVVTLQNEK